MSQMRTRPLWQGAPRGAAIATMAVLDPPPKEEQGSFLEKLGSRLYNVTNDVTAGVIGFLLTVGVLGSGVVALTAARSPVAAALLIMAAIAWTIACLAAALLVYRGAEQASTWARGLVTILVAMGRMVAIIAVIVTVIVILYLIVAIVVSASSAGRSR